MLGAIIGDIVGSKYEFNNTLDYDFEMFAEGSDFTDDSICTVAVADAILKGKTYKDACWSGVVAILRQREAMADDSRCGFILIIRSLMAALEMVRRCEFLQLLGSSMTWRR